MDNTDATRQQIEQLATAMQDLLARYHRVREENRSLLASQEQLATERAALLARNEQARTRVEAMIQRLKSLENNS